MQINRLDNVDINLENGHKYALCDIKKGSQVIKYGFPIGVATENIKKGEHVHSHNVKTALDEKAEKRRGDFSHESGQTPQNME